MFLSCVLNRSVKKLFAVCLYMDDALHCTLLMFCVKLSFVFSMKPSVLPITVEPVLKDRLICHKNRVSQDRWSLVTGSITLKCRTSWQEYVVLQDMWSFMAVVSQDRFHCTSVYNTSNQHLYECVYSFYDVTTVTVCVKHSQYHGVSLH